MHPDRCGTQTWLNSTNTVSPAFREQYIINEKLLGEAVKKNLTKPENFNTNRTTGVVYIPIVFHVVVADQSKVTDAMIYDQLVRINEDYAGINADSANGSPFFNVRGHSTIQFCLAKRSPTSPTTNGIVRVTSTVQSNLRSGDPIKYSAQGGSSAWDPQIYINIWIADLPSGFLGYGTFPGSINSEQGVVILSGTLPGGNEAPYNKGRTLTHELGHYFWLLHPWGSNRCDSDFPNTPGIDDTPDQADPTYGCPSGLIESGCTSPSPLGKMYQNFMDYTDDGCMTMFTKGQNIRVDQAITLFRSSLLTSNGCLPVVPLQNEAGIISISNPTSQLCTSNGNAVIVIKNFGINNLTSAKINYQLDATGIINTIPWTGNLGWNQTAIITIPNTYFGGVGNHSFRAFTSEPNGVADQDPSNDGVIKTFQVLQIFNRLGNVSYTEEFTSSTFPPVSWTIVNPDADMTWQRNATIGKTNSGTAWFNDFRNTTNNRIDDLLLPNYSYSGVDSVFLTFNLAHISKTVPGIPGANYDTLSILLSKDCGNTFQTIYKKFGAELQTVFLPLNPTTEFFPTANQWRLDSLNLGQWLRGTESLVQLGFRFHGNSENNLFLDDVTFRTEILPARLKKEGYILYPVPFRNKVNVWHLETPVNLQFINVYSSSGQLVWARNTKGNARTLIEIDLSSRASGVYTVLLGYLDKTKNVSVQVVKY